MSSKLQRKTTLFCVFIPDFFLNGAFLMTNLQKKERSWSALFNEDQEITLR